MSAADPKEAFTLATIIACMSEKTLVVATVDVRRRDCGMHIESSNMYSTREL